MTDDAEFAVMEFYASWCPHCQNFGPKWEAVAAFFNKGVGHDPSGTRPDPRVTVFSVDCVTEGDMCQAFTVRGYPTVLFGTLAQFKREHAKKGSGALDKIAVGSPETVIRQIGTKTGGLYVLSPAARGRRLQVTRRRRPRRRRRRRPRAPPRRPRGRRPRHGPGVPRDDLPRAPHPGEPRRVRQLSPPPRRDTSRGRV